MRNRSVLRHCAIMVVCALVCAMVCALGAEALPWPTISELSGVEAAWTFPDKHPQALCLLFHGAATVHTDWWDLPWHAHISRHLHKEGYALFAIGSGHQRGFNNSLWGFTLPPTGSRLYNPGLPATSNEMVRDVSRAVALFYETMHLSPDLPLFGIGASNGGSFMFVLASAWAEWLSGAETSDGPPVSPWTLQFNGLYAISANPPPDLKMNPAWTPPLALVTMPRDTKFTGPQIPKVRQAWQEAGAPLLERYAYPYPIRASTFSDAVSALSLEESAAAVECLIRHKHLAPFCSARDRRDVTASARLLRPEPGRAPPMLWMKWPPKSVRVVSKALETAPLDVLDRMEDSCMLFGLPYVKPTVGHRLPLAVGAFEAVLRRRRQLGLYMEDYDRNVSTGMRSGRELLWHHVKEVIEKSFGFHATTDDFVEEVELFLWENRSFRARQVA